MEVALPLGFGCRTLAPPTFELQSVGKAMTVRLRRTGASCASRQHRLAARWRSSCAGAVGGGCATGVGTRVVGLVRCARTTAATSANRRHFATNAADGF
eukprot:14830-Eustigmatos_ZCMA.PRE.1